MKLLDPQRPRLDGMALYAPQGLAANARFGIPTIYLDTYATDAGEPYYLLTIHMPTSGNAYAGFQARIEGLEALYAFHARWLEDPEQEIEVTFKYRWDAIARKLAGRGARIAAEVSQGLSELGLL